MPPLLSPISISQNSSQGSSLGCLASRGAQALGLVKFLSITISFIIHENVKKKLENKDGTVTLGTLRIFYYKAARQKVKQKTKGTSFMTG
jgi:hypothetical protein